MEFIYNNISSKDFGIKIKVNGTNHLSSPQKSFKNEVVVGRNGEVFTENDTYENFILEIDCYIDARGKDIDEAVTSIKRWLQTDLDYKKLVLSNKSTYYEAVCVNKLDIAEVFRNFGECVLRFSCKPLKKVSNQEVITITEKTILNNIYMKSRPIFKIFGSGNITLYTNNQITILKDVVDHVIIDSEEYECYKEDVNGLKTYLNHKMHQAFPVLKEGENDISWIGNITKIEIMPNWVVV